jgi:hypothetical protein
MLYILSLDFRDKKSLLKEETYDKTKCSIMDLVILTFLVVEILFKHNEMTKEHPKGQMFFTTLYV